MTILWEVTLWDSKVVSQGGSFGYFNFLRVTFWSFSKWGSRVLKGLQKHSLLHVTSSDCILIKAVKHPKKESPCGKTASPKPNKLNYIYRLLAPVSGYEFGVLWLVGRVCCSLAGHVSCWSLGELWAGLCMRHPKGNSEDTYSLGRYFQLLYEQ